LRFVLPEIRNPRKGLEKNDMKNKKEKKFGLKLSPRVAFRMRTIGRFNVVIGEE